MKTPLEEKIERLKIEKNVAILAHFYEEGNIQDIADYVGDSLYLAQKSTELKQKTVLLAGVVFMAESVKIVFDEFFSYPNSSKKSNPENLGIVRSKSIQSKF